MSTAFIYSLAVTRGQRRSTGLLG